MASRLFEIAARFAWKRVRRAADRREMQPLEFELLLGEGFRLLGYIVVETGGAADLVLQKGHEQYLVQARHWRAPRVDVDAIRALAAAIEARKAVGGFAVTTGEFGAEAIEWARGRNIHLMPGDKLARLLEKARQTLTMPPRIEPRLGRGALPVR